MQNQDFFQDAQHVCANAIDLLLKSWTDATPAATMRETLQGLNGLKDYFAAQQ